MALCPHCWESLAEPIPAVCPACGRAQPLYMEIPDVPPDMGDTPAAEWSIEALMEAGPAPPEPSPEAPREPPHPPTRESLRGDRTVEGSSPHEPRGVAALVILVAAIVGFGALAAIPFDVAIRDAAGRVVETGATAEDQLAIGDCYGPDLELGEAHGAAVTATPCSEPHLWEVVGRLKHPDDEYPGEAAMEQWTIDLCRRAFEQYVGAVRLEGVQMWYRYPREANWEGGSRTAWCLATRGEPSVGSVRGG